MIDLTKISVVAPPESVVKKLSRANIAFFGLKKEGFSTTFCVGGKSIKKVFAIFAHPCYNICVLKYGALRSFALRCAARAGLIAGVALFVAAVSLSRLFVFRVKVVGSGSYLAPQVVTILAENGVREGSICPSYDSPVVLSAIMRLPGVSFCSVQREGVAVVVDVECSSSPGVRPVYSPLLSPVAGRVEGVCVLSGTASVAVGDDVSAGDELISPQFELPSGESADCLCAGYVRIRAEALLSSHAQSRSEQSLSSALAAVRIWYDDARVLSHTVRQVSQGFIYTVTFTYIHTASINMQ